MADLEELGFIENSHIIWTCLRKKDIALCGSFIITREIAHHEMQRIKELFANEIYELKQLSKMRLKYYLS